jgi:hypothetical protein
MTRLPVMTTLTLSPASSAWLNTLSGRLQLDSNLVGEFLLAWAGGNYFTTTHGMQRLVSPVADREKILAWDRRRKEIAAERETT